MSIQSLSVWTAGVLLTLSMAAPVFGSEPIDPAAGTTDADAGITWYDAHTIGVEGQAWPNTKAPFDRLPAKAEGVVRAPVWSLSRHSAGLCVRFETDATAIHARWTLTSSRLAMPHMPATGVSGLDLYVRHEGRWRWLGVGQPREQQNTARLVDGIPDGRREYLVYLPLYNGVESLSIGIPSDEKLWRGATRDPKRRQPIVFWGTSITQGGCASRTGMVHTAIVGRELERPVINLGFSGNGRMEPEVARLLAEVDAAVYVIDCLPNLTADRVEERTEPLVHILRESHPTTPILLVEDRTYSDSFLVGARHERNRTNRVALKAAFNRLREAGVGELYYLQGEQLLSEAGDDTVDGSHPTDLGFQRQAEAFAKVLRPILEDAGSTAADAASFSEYDVFVSGEDGYDTYRIPAVIATPSGALLAFCEARKDGRGDAGNIDLVAKRSHDNGQTWSAMQVIWDDENNTCGNPCPVVDQSTGRIWLPLTWNLGSDHEREIVSGKSRDTRRVFMSYSDDDGRTWADPYEITESAKRPEWTWYATGPGNAIQIQHGPHRGRLVVPCDHKVAIDDNVVLRSHCIYSDDHGESWQMSEPLDATTNESAVVELSDGRLQLNMRCYGKSKRRAIAWSSDGGQKWTSIEHDEVLVEPVCQGSLIRYSWPSREDKGLVLFSNPASSKRERMTVRLSEDDGKTWTASRVVNPESSAYSSLVVVPNGQVGLLYERDRYGRIVFARFSTGWIREQQ